MDDIRSARSKGGVGIVTIAPEKERQPVGNTPGLGEASYIAARTM